MNRKEAIDACRYIMAGPRAYEMERLDRIAEALLPWTEEQAQYLLAGTGHTEEPSIGMKWRSQTNFLPLVLDVYSPIDEGRQLSLESTTKETAGPWEWWQRNKMVARQTGLVRGALEFGVSYTTVLPSMRPPGVEQGEPGAYIRCLSPRQMTCLYGEPVEWEPGVTPIDDDWPIIALEIKDKMVRLYDEEQVHFIGVQNVPESALGWTRPAVRRVRQLRVHRGPPSRCRRLPGGAVPRSLAAQRRGAVRHHRAADQYPGPCGRDHLRDERDASISRRSSSAGWPAGGRRTRCRR